MINRLSALSISFFLHGLFVLAYVVMKLNIASFLPLQKIPVEVLQYPEAVPAQLKLQPTKPQAQEKKPIDPPVKKVFGISRKAMTAINPSENTAEIKQGNTVAKEIDNLKLDKTDPDSIPIPADDYLVTSQVSLLKDVRIPYPLEAKKNNIEGPVVMDLIVDQNGKVRSVVLVRGPGSGLNEAAVEAAKSFEFRPAKVGDQNVAVKIRYTYRFVLENR
jgi:periplasmic protein TonB